MPTFTPPGLGWHRDLPDGRDYCLEHEQVAPLLAGLRHPGGGRGKRPPTVDWRAYFLPVESQRGLQASAAYAVAALVEYFERRAYGRLVEGSRLFLYQMARRLLQWKGDSGAPLRATLKALRRFGLPPRRYWPDDWDHLDDEPSPFLFSFAREYETLLYVRLDSRPSDPGATLTTVKASLTAGLPVAFGFTVFDSLGPDPEVPFPSCADAAVGGQAVVAVGYDDGRATRSGRGALRVRPSWGSDWGEDGYGWLPYGYVKEGLAADFWTILRPDWLETGEFLPFL